ncbi:MAG: hydrogenase maturation protease [Eubacteriales bacterium]|nr:hydrogenase maturation protease [Bacillota bacterium]MBV1726570.1 hydrogenase maturation protease [Desulforudis sp.]MDP3050880.1 hydrogenase maturation protease [Eubacteriales bacterium]MDQ7788704.1 hydrogenase maturation protease [Clostridia bacterium]MBU4532068.1 hydrogenase maturation protease [Bacillota bacterium]
MDDRQGRLRIVVLGCGNIFAGDDGVGIEVLRALEQDELISRLVADSRDPGSTESAAGGSEHTTGRVISVSLLEAGAPGLGMLDHMIDFDKAVIIDAVAGIGEPGRIVRWHEDEIPRKNAPPVSVHDISIRDALEFGRRSVPELLPSEVVIIGVVVAQMEAWHMGLTPEVVEAVPKAAQAVKSEIERWISEAGRV